MSCALASCALAPAVPPRHGTPPSATATPTPTPPATVSPRPGFDEAPLDEYPPLEGGREVPAQDGLLPEGSVPTAPEPESMLTRISSSTPPSVAAAYRLIEEGRRLLARGDVDQALHRLERSVSIDPTNAYGYYFLAQVHLQSRAYGQALAFAGRAAALSARSDRRCESRAYTLQGVVYEQVGRFADARAVYAKALHSDPRNAVARLGLGRLSGE